MSRPKRFASLLAAGALAVTLTACSDGGDPTTDQSANDTATSQQTEVATDDSTQGDADSGATGDGTDGADSQSGAESDAEASGAAAAGIDLANRPSPIGSTTLELEWRGNDHAIETEVLELKTRGELMYMTLRLTPESARSDADKIYGWLGNSGLGLTLIDPVNLKMYSPVRTSTGPVETDVVGNNVSSGESAYHWVVFPAPVDDVETLDLQFSRFGNVIAELPVS